MQLSFNHAKFFEHIIFAKPQHPYTTAGDVLKRVIIVRVGVLAHIGILPCPTLLTQTDGVSVVKLSICCFLVFIPRYNYVFRIYT